MKAIIYHTFVFTVLAALAASAQAQQAPAPRRVKQPLYEATNSPAYASQYAATAEGPASGDDNQNPYRNLPAAVAYDGAGFNQVAHLTYKSQPGGAAPGTGMSQPGGCCGACPTACCDDCCEPFWAHRNSVFADWLYLKARNGSDVANAIPQNGIGGAAVPFGQVGSNSPTYQPSGFRIGGVYAINRCASIAAAYTYYQGESNGSTFANPPLVV
ncbi:MAG TPA: hypothetical protein PK867_26430, partial [Pirellulales bacterium]|nr:hypothetical protein [Pirellulales bacterium]